MHRWLWPTLASLLIGGFAIAYPALDPTGDISDSGGAISPGTDIGVNVGVKVCTDADETNDDCTLSSSDGVVVHQVEGTTELTIETTGLTVADNMSFSTTNSIIFDVDQEGNDSIGAVANNAIAINAGGANTVKFTNLGTELRAATILFPNIQIALGANTANDGVIFPDATNDAIYLSGGDNYGRIIIIGPRGSAGVAHGHTDLGYQQLCGHSNTAFGSSTTQNWCLAHDATDANFTVESGDYNVKVEGGDINLLDTAATTAAVHEMHGSMYQRDNASATTINTINVWEEVNNFSTGVVRGVTFGGGGDLTVTNTGRYLLMSSIIASGGANDEIEFAFSVDDTIKDECIAKRKLSAGGDIGAVSLSCLLAITAAEVVKLETRDTTGTTDILVVHSNVSLTQL